MVLTKMTTHFLRFLTHILSKIQLAMLKRQFKLRKKLQMWRDIQLDHFGFERTQGINRPFVYSHIPGPVPVTQSMII